MQRVRRFVEHQGVTAVQKHRREADSAGWVGRHPAHLAVVCLCVASGLPCHGRDQNVHAHVSDPRQRECAMWVRDCARHVLVTGWFGGASESRVSDLSDRI